MVAKIKKTTPVTATGDEHIALDEILSTATPSDLYKTAFGKLNYEEIDNLLDYISGFCEFRDPDSLEVIIDEHNNSEYNAVQYAGHLEVLVRRMYKELIYIAFFAGVYPAWMQGGHGRPPTDIGIDSYSPEVRKAIALAFYGQELSTLNDVDKETFFRCYSDRAIDELTQGALKAPPSFQEAYTEAIYGFATSVYATKI